MKKSLYLTLLCITSAAIVFLVSTVCSAQHMSFRYSYKMEPAMITEPPVLPNGPDFQYPDAAQKNGVEGKAIVTFTLGEDSKVRDVRVVQGLPNGVTEALVDAVKKIYFKPAKKDGVPAPVDLTLELNILLVFDENDPNIKKPKITLLPPAVYPESQRAEKFKGKVSVSIICAADGTLKVNGVSSVLPKDFDKAAAEAAKEIKFEPAVHKKSQKAVTQVITVEFDFKP